MRSDRQATGLGRKRGQAAFARFAITKKLFERLADALGCGDGFVMRETPEHEASHGAVDAGVAAAREPLIFLA